jgi:MSHA biogenesis protein MshQ
MRAGRARMLNAYGSELLDLPVVFRTEYWNGTGWVLNGDDSCTDATLAFAAAGVRNITGNICVIEPSNNSGEGCAAAPTQANRKYLEAGVTGTDSTGTAGFAGNFNLWLKAPGATYPGSIDITATVPAWLQHNWSGTVANPTARATFGIYKSPLIYRRENY